MKLYLQVIIIRICLFFSTSKSSFHAGYHFFACIFPFNRFFLFSFPDKLEEDCPGAGAVIKIEKDNLLPGSEAKHSIGEGNGQGWP